MDDQTLPPDARPLTTQELRRTKPNRNEFPNLPRTPIHLVLDRVSSAANVGNIFRLADALRAEHLWLCGGSPVSLESRRFLRAAKSMAKWVPHSVATYTSDVVRSLKTRGVTILGVELAPNSVGLAAAKFRGPVAIIVGQESEGIQPGVLALCDLVLALPMLGMGNSINAATAVAAVGYWALGTLAKGDGI